MLEEKKEIHYCINCGKEIKNNKGKFCSKDGSIEYNYKENIKKWQEGNDCGYTGKGISIKDFIRKYLFEKNNYKCEKCGWGEINPKTQQVPLQIHHIDGDCTNNREENLQLLCPNCHSLTETFGRLNKGSKRKR